MIVVCAWSGVGFTEGRVYKSVPYLNTRAFVDDDGYKRWILYEQMNTPDPPKFLRELTLKDYLEQL